MGILFNGEKIVISSNPKTKVSYNSTIEEFTDHKRKQVRIKYLKAMIQPNKADKRYPTKPKSKHIKLTGNFIDDQGISHTVQYYETEVPSRVHNGMFDYLPKTLELTGEKVVYDEGRSGELLWFLYNCSPKCQNGRSAHLGDGDHWFYVENLVKEAKKEYTDRQDKSKIATMLYDPDKGLGDAEARRLARAMFIPNVDSMEFEEIILMLENRVQNETDRKEFIRLVENLEDADLKSAIQIAADCQVIGVDAPHGTWHYMEKNTRDYGKRIMQIVNQHKPNQELYEFLRARPDELETFMRVVEPVLPTEKAGKPAKLK